MRAHLNLNDCSGAKVSAGFNSASVAKKLGQESPYIKRGTELTVDILKSIPTATLDAMVTNGRNLVLRPKPAAGSEPAVAAAPVKEPEKLNLERVVVDAGGGKFDVIEGVKINAKPLSKKAANKLADAKAGEGKPKH